jgi:hypothetical protein
MKYPCHVILSRRCISLCKTVIEVKVLMQVQKPADKLVIKDGSSLIGRRKCSARDKLDTSLKGRLRIMTAIMMLIITAAAAAATATTIMLTIIGG